MCFWVEIGWEQHQYIESIGSGAQPACPTKYWNILVFVLAQYKYWKNICHILAHP